jgi:acetyl esterase/lipase
VVAKDGEEGDFRGNGGSARFAGPKNHQWEDHMRRIALPPARAGLAMVAVALTLLAAHGAAAQGYGVVAKPGVQYVEHDGVKLTGDFYAPKGLDKAPVIIAVHGGGWQNGSPDAFKHLGPFLARNGYAVYAIRYRLAKPGVKSYPAAVYDVKAAIQFVRAKAADLGVDPARIALLGASAGAQLVSLVGVAGTEPQFSTLYRDDPNAAVSPDVKAVVSFYGIYDMQAQWEHDQIARPADQITEKFIGVPPMKDRRAYFESSPAAYATFDKNRPRFLLIAGKEDDIVNPKQATDFLTLLKQARFNANIVLLPGAGHGWIGEPMDDPTAFVSVVAPRVLRFLQAGL